MAPKTPGSQPGPYHEWFNPYGEKVKDVIPEQGCSTMPMPADPIPPKVPLEGAEAGWRFATYTLLVDAVRVPHGELKRFDLEYCIPVSLYVYVTASGQPGTVIQLAPIVETTDAGVIRHTTPWNALRNTPWRATIIVKWDPKATSPPVMNFELSARLERGPGLAELAEPKDATIGMMCRIRQDTNVFSMSMSTDVFAPSAKLDVPDLTGEYFQGPFVKCRPPAFSAIAK
jgi:hypothetical protein